MNEDKEDIIYVCNSAMHIDNEYFSQTQALPDEAFMPLFNVLRKKCDRKIVSGGDYKFELKIVKLK